MAVMVFAWWFWFMDVGRSVVVIGPFDNEQICADTKNEMKAANPLALVGKKCFHGETGYR